MSFSSSTVMTLSGGGSPGGGPGGDPAPPTGSIGTDYSRPAPAGNDWPDIPAPHRRVRQRPTATQQRPAQSSYSDVPGGGHYYAPAPAPAPAPQRTTPGSGTINVGQSYDNQNFNQGYANVNQNVNQAYDAPDANRANYGTAPTINQTYDAPDPNRANYATAPTINQTYGQDPNRANYAQTYAPPTNDQQSPPPPQSYAQVYDTLQTTGTGQTFSPAYPEYGMGPQSHAQPSTGTGTGHGTSMDISNQGYKKPGAGQQPVPMVTSNIQTLSATTMALPPAVLASYRRKFDHMDLNKDGIVTMREFMAVSRVFGYKLTADEMAQIFGKRDLDDSGGVTFDEFVTAMQERARKNKELQPVRQHFRMFDIRSRGYLTSDDIHPKFEKELGFDESKTEGFFELYDKNKDYRISHLEFVDFYQAYLKLKTEIDQAFHEFDRNGDGYVDIYELNSKLAPKGFTEEEVETLMKKYDKDMDSRLNRQEFATFWDVPIF